MRLPDWSEERVDKYSKLWGTICEETQKYGFKRYIKSSEVPPRRPGLGLPGAHRAPRSHSTRNGVQPALSYYLFAKLLSTQEGNPVKTSLLEFFEGEQNRENCYREVEIPKKRGGVREIAMPRHPLKWLQRSLLQVFTHLFPRHKCAHGFERGKDITTHAKQHVGRRWVYCTDIKDFFPSITWGRVYGMFQAYPFDAPAPLARYLANLVTYKGQLPQGAPTSPILANLLCRRLDSRLFKWARSNGYIYSRYADDLTFSTDRNEFSEKDRAFIDRIVNEEGFEIHSDKRRLMPRWGRQIVTGIVVNEKLNLPRDYVRGLRAILHNIRCFGWESQVNRPCHFADADAYASYCDGSLDTIEAENLREKASKKKLLLSPSSAIHSAGDVSSLRNVLRGRIEFLGHVKGRDDKTYRKLKQTFDALAGYEDEKSLVTSELYPEASPFVNRKTNGFYYRYQRLLEKLDDRSIDETDFRKKLSEWSDEIVEFRWLLDLHPYSDIPGNLNSDSLQDVREKALRIAYRADLHPHITATFFKSFDDYRYFRGLLHRAQPTDDGYIRFPNGTERKPGTLISDCDKVFKRFENRLPNFVSNATESVLEECDKWLRTQSTESEQLIHPWMDSSFREKYLSPYKKKMKFVDKESLIKKLQGKADRLREQHDCNIYIENYKADLYTGTEDVEQAVELLLEVLCQHAENPVYVKMEPGRVGTDFDELILKMYEEDSSVKGKPPVLHKLLSGESQGALDLLRGYARWTVTADFEESSSTYRFDVMSNSRNELSSPANMFCFELSFYQ